jgi:site-specific DNA-methyltransferase (adenine-specific)
MPSTATISRDEFLEATTDLWEIPPESATRVGHPAPFPVAIPKRLIELYTYEGDVVLDPFMGSGTTAIAALRTDRHYIGFDTDKAYVTSAKARVMEERERLDRQDPLSNLPFRVQLPAVSSADETEDFQARAVREGRQAKDLAGILLGSCGFVNIQSNVKLSDLGIELNFVAEDQTGHHWAFDVSGAFTSSRAGLKRTDTLWKALGKAAVLHEGREDMTLVLLTTDAPARNSAGHAALKSLMGSGRPVFDLIELLNTDHQEKLCGYALRGHPDR